MSTNGLAALGSLRRALDGFDQSSRPWVVLATVLLDRTRWAADVATSDAVQARARGIAIWQVMNFIRAQPSGQGLPVARVLDRVRRLIRLGDDRDLRQLPIAAQAIDAVRLMTVHGAKGLEFPVVHLRGMNSDTLPRSFVRPECPPPDGMIEGATVGAEAALRAGHDEEQECLFYVALSRARDRLFFYATTKKQNGHIRQMSLFLNHVGTGLRRSQVVVGRSPVPAPEGEPIAIVVQGVLRYGATQPALFESCPRRFLYTHVLQLGGRRLSTAFMQMHDAARSVVQDITERGHAPSAAELDQQLDDAFNASGLASHGHAGDYKALALAMVRRYAARFRNPVRRWPRTQ